MSRNEDSLVVYSDYVCPFCYLGRESLAEYEDERGSDLDIEWRPFDLRAQKSGSDGEIDDSVDDGKDESYFDQVRENVTRLREQYDADEMLDLDETPDVDSLDAQIASLSVQEAYPEQWRAFDEAIFEALWIDGRDIGDVDVLAELAEEVSLDGDDIRAAVADKELRERVRDRFSQAHEDGVTGVPTFAYDGYAARGAVPPEQLERLVDGA